jgi:hypothetical protein
MKEARQHFHLANERIVSQCLNTNIRGKIGYEPEMADLSVYM